MLAAMEAPSVDEVVLLRNRQLTARHLRLYSTLPTEPYALVIITMIWYHVMLIMDAPVSNRVCSSFSPMLPRRLQR